MDTDTQQKIRRLEASEASLRRIITRNADAIIIVDQTGIVRFANPAARQLFQCKCENLLNTMFGFPITLDDDTVELDLVCEGKVMAVVEMRVVEIEWEGQPALLASMRDITHHKRNQQLEHSRTQVLELITQNESIDAILNQIASMVEHQHPDMLCSILLMQDGCLRWKAGASVPQTYINAMNDCRLNADMCPCIQSMGDHQHPRREQPVPACRIQITNEGLQPPHVHPLFSRERDLYGMLILYSQQALPLTEADLKLIDVAGYLAVVAIEQRTLTDQLHYQAHHDTLTGLPNRLLLEQRLQQTLHQAQQQHTSIAVFFIDLDRFKHINDTLGHPVGDLLLQQVAQRLEASVRDDDTLARTGGDEFMLVTKRATSMPTIRAISHRLIEALTTPFAIEGRELFTGASIGVSIYPHDGCDATTLQRNADIAMYRAKSAGGNTFRCFDAQMNATALEQLELESELRRALDTNEFELYYQPQVDQRRKLVGVEAVLRWNHPVRGLLPAASFIDLAEETGLIVPIGIWMLQEACRQRDAWQKAGYPFFKVSVNISTPQFMQSDFVERVRQALTTHTNAWPYLELEMVEDALIPNIETAFEKLAALQTLDVSIAIDNFGKGYSSLSCLQQLPISTIKIDQSFIGDIESETSRAHSTTAIISAITTLGSNLGIRVVAKGVETEEQFLFLRAIGCNGMQGNLFSPAIPAHSFEALLHQTMTGEDGHFFCTPEPYYDTMI